MSKKNSTNALIAEIASRTRTKLSVTKTLFISAAIPGLVLPCLVMLQPSITRPTSQTRQTLVDIVGMIFLDQGFRLHPPVAIKSL